MESTTSSTASSREFKPGDKVICIDAEQAGSKLTLGKTYIVRGVAVTPLFSEGTRVFLSEIPYDACGFYPSRFKLLTTTFYGRRQC